MTEEDKISRRYRELTREEPPRRVDETILAASRRAVHTHPAPLVVPSGRQRWYFPLAAAAIIVLAVGVTMHMQWQQPAEEMVSSNTTAAPAPAPAPQQEAVAPARRSFEMRDEASAQKRRSAAENFEQDKRAASGERREQSEPAPRLDLQAPPPPPELQKSLEVAATAPAPSQDALRAQQSVGSVLSRVEAARPQAAPAPQAKAAAPKLSASAAQSPEQWLQGIADLRGQGYHEEADRQLVEFRKRYPAYRIPEAMREQVERRTSK